MRDLVRQKEIQRKKSQDDSEKFLSFYKGPIFDIFIYNSSKSNCVMSSLSVMFLDLEDQ